MSGVPMVSAALWYAEQGLLVHPLLPLKKEPASEHGFKDASSDPNDIIRWWEARPDYNIGIATGHLVDVIDVDPPRGFRSLVKMMDDDEPENGRILGSLILGTASTCRPLGLHYYVPATGGGCVPGTPTSTHVNVDFKGLGGYVVAPPSVVEHQDDDGNYLPGTGVQYRWRHQLNLSGLQA